ncbi:hypothetical protein AC1031_011827 [Aphanomyces cochlioides]|nr:hypothetical protein AC1031_011827 [Aphanomyces cochlioides]
MAPKLSDDEKLRRRLYFRDKQREHRNRLRHDIVAAKAEFEDLTALATPLKAKHRPLVDADGALSWCVVAGVFREELNSSTSEHQSLLKETRARGTLLKAMQRFVSLNLQLEPEGPVRHWHPATLLEHPQARELGKEWLTQQLYHNKDSRFQIFACARMDEEVYGVDVDISNDCTTYVQTMQQIWPGTIDSCRSFFQNHTETLIFRPNSNFY